MNFKDALEILRPINGIMGSLTVVIGILNTRVGSSFPLTIINIILGVLTYFFLSGAGMVINDIYDVEIDKINRPKRPIPSERVTLKQAKSIYMATLLVGVSLSIIHVLVLKLNYFIIILAVVFGIMGWVYAAWGKGQGFIGNIIVSISFSIGLIYGALLNGTDIPLYIYYFFLTSFCLLMAREIVKGCEDIEGDKKEGVKTLAISLDPRKAMIISILFQGLAILFFISPLFTKIINPVLFMALLIPGIGIVGFALILSAQQPQNKENYRKISLFLKLGALVGLLAFLFASL